MTFILELARMAIALVGFATFIWACCMLFSQYVMLGDVVGCVLCAVLALSMVISMADALDVSACRLANMDFWDGFR